MKKYFSRFNFSYLYTLALSQTAKSTYLTSVGAGINAFLGFVFTILVARSVSPADFGLFSVVLNLTTVLLVIADVGFSSSILRFLPQAIRDGKKKKARQIIKLAFLTTLIISGFLAFLIFIFSKPLATGVFVQPRLVLPFVIASFSIVGLSLSYLLVSILQGQQRFLFGVITEVSLMAVRVFAIIALLFLKRLDLISTMIVFSGTSFVGFLLGFFFIKPAFLFAKTDFKLLKNLFKFGLWVAVARIANAISGRIDTLMLVRFIDPDGVGYYAAAQKMTFIFPVLVTGVTVVLSPKMAALKTLEEVKVFGKKALLLVSSLFPLVFILFILSPQLVIWIYGSAYIQSNLIFRYLLLSSVFFIATTVPTIIILYHLGSAKFFAFLSVLQLVLVFLINLFLIPKIGAIGPAISLAIAYGIVFLVSSFFIYFKFNKEK